eukprot:scpid4537/ scgid29676/ 
MNADPQRLTDPWQPSSCSSVHPAQKAHGIASIVALPCYTIPPGGSVYTPFELWGDLARRSHQLSQVDISTAELSIKHLIISTNETSTIKHLIVSTNVGSHWPRILMPMFGECIRSTGYSRSASCLNLHVSRLTYQYRNPQHHTRQL